MSETLQQFGKHFQEQLVYALLTDKIWAEQMLEVFDVSFFDLKYLNFLAEKYFSYAKKYKDFPTLPLLATIIRNDLKTTSDILLRDQIIDYLLRIKTNQSLSDLPYVKEKSLDFARKQALKDALNKSVDLMATEKYESIVDVIKKAVTVGTVASQGHDLFEDVEARFVSMKRECIPIGIKELDKDGVLNGGVGEGELLSFIASTGGGKCVERNTTISIKYAGILVNGVLCRPWEYKKTEDKTNNISCIVSEYIKIGELFDSLKFSSDITPDSDGENLEKCCWHIEVLGENGYNKIEALRWTKLESMTTLVYKKHKSNYVKNNHEYGSEYLTCAPEHLVRKIDNTWVFVKELKEGDFIVGVDGEREVIGLINHDNLERLCDLQVENVHNYYANGILSHNSHFLVSVGCSAMRSKKNVAHYTLELSEVMTGIRYDANILGIDANDVFSKKDEVIKFYEENKKNLGRLMIKSYPTGTASVMTLRAHIEKLTLSGFKPDIVLIDYADIMRSSRKFDSLRHELKLIYEELRSLAQELKIPICTCSQSNKEGSNNDVITENNMSEGFSKAFVCDIILTLSRKPLEKASGRGRLFLAKNRAGIDGLLYPIKINTARSTFEIVGEQITEQTASNEDQNQIKSALKKKWEALQQDSNIKLVSKKDSVAESKTDVEKI